MNYYFSNSFFIKVHVQLLGLHIKANSHSIPKQ